MSEIKLNHTQRTRTTTKTARPAGNQLNKLPNPAKLSEKLLYDLPIQWARGESSLIKKKETCAKCGGEREGETERRAQIV